jgi:hypothetical protein
LIDEHAAIGHQTHQPHFRQYPARLAHRARLTVSLSATSLSFIRSPGARSPLSIMPSISRCTTPVSVWARSSATVT